MLCGSSPFDILIRDLWVLLPYTLYSLLRMFIALAISYLYAIPYGVAAASSRRAEKILMPILDILQSVPILGFFPAAILFFIMIFRESWIGVELAAIFLIFTSQAWNLAFAVYESASTIPSDLDEASTTLHLKGLARFRNLILPACIPKLVYNGMMSWAGGWYFLVAAEMITLGSRAYALPGVGRYLAESTYSGDFPGTILGLAFMVLTVLAVDRLLWKPLRTYAEQFRYEYVSLGGAPQPSHLSLSPMMRLRGLFKTPVAIKDVVHPFPVRLEPVVDRLRYVAVKPGKLLGRHVKVMICAVALLGCGLAATRISEVMRYVYLLWSTLTEPFWNPELKSEVANIPAALATSVMRLFSAYLLSLAWTLPLAVKIGSERRMFEASASLIQVLASIPATALFPIIILATMGLPGGLQLTSIILTMTGMQWYLLFNLIGGVRSIPSDIIEASEAYRLDGFAKFRKVIIPAILPSLITGSITGLGGGWNALVVSEYVVFGGKSMYVLGIGAMIDKAAYELGSFSLLLTTIIVMSATIILMNRLLWRRLYHSVFNRYRIDY
ncbi:MAG: ABC transporter permease subunit [Candidatus Bathyarchaeia archaeon]